MSRHHIRFVRDETGHSYLKVRARCAVPKAGIGSSEDGGVKTVMSGPLTNRDVISFRSRLSFGYRGLPIRLPITDSITDLTTDSVTYYDIVSIIYKYTIIHVVS